ncbi:hypothetical protein GPECTOR_7g1041 [Gonium pectorale]|uniref:Uncharacterized protein n=1 Tax=Gonium pectorale TaxID=33097 RepID=A0A150GTJ3_GONPE|nr:hypothetical protein GPECTOR_7g1041 [Gonium pectorale]|eukprot:KXZ53149.1 hypothetical protein GPECTOR_7g1041 [Gonium pectorale]
MSVFSCKLTSATLGRAVLAAVTSLVCISLHIKRHGGADLQMSSSLSLLFGLIRLQGSASLKLGCGDKADAAAASGPQNEEFRINCPQGLKEHIVRFLEAQARRDPAALPPWQLSPQKQPTPGSCQAAAASPPPFPAAAAASPLLPVKTVAIAGAPDGVDATSAGSDGSCGSAAAIATASGSSGIARLVEMLLPPPPLVCYPHRMSGPAGAGSQGAAEVSDGAGDTPRAQLPAAAGGRWCPEKGGAMEAEAFGSQFSTPDATPDYNSSSGSATTATPSLSRTSIASASPGATQHGSKTQTAAAALAAAAAATTSHPRPQPAATASAAPATAACSRQRRSTDSEPWCSPALLASLGPSVEDQPTTLDHTALSALMTAAATYRPSLPPGHGPGRTNSPAPPPPAAPAAPLAIGVSCASHAADAAADARYGSDAELPYSSAASRYGSAASSCYGSAASSVASAASAAARGSAAGTALPLRKSPDSILGLRGLGLEGWNRNAREWERVHGEEPASDDE